MTQGRRLLYGRANIEWPGFEIDMSAPYPAGIKSRVALAMLRISCWYNGRDQEISRKIAVHFRFPAAVKP